MSRELRMLSRKEFNEAVRQVITYYASGTRDGSFERHMDYLTMNCSDTQWKAITLYLEQVNAWMADTDKGTTAQKEKAAAQREHRKSRYPSALLQHTSEAQAMIAKLKKEFGTEEKNT